MLKVIVYPYEKISHNVNNSYWSVIRVCWLGWRKMKMPDNAVLLDVRQADEFNAGHIDGAVLVPHDTIAEKIGAVVPDKNTPLFVYCRSGRRSAIAVKAMKKLGYTDLTDLGGMDEAKKSLRK